MHWGMIRICNCLLVIASLSILCVTAASASAAPSLSGTYQVVHRSEAAGQTQIQVQIHLVNHGPRELHIQRITLWDFSHPAKGGTQSSSLVLPSAGSADTTQDFTVPRAEYELWKRGARPRLVLEIESPHGHPATEVVHLDRVSGGKGD
jgi:hypothetical protein